MTSFSTLGLSEALLNMLTREGFETPTPIQIKAIPELLAGRDIIGLAQTGTGKTAAFGLPLIDRLIAENIRPEPKAVRALILAPTRELVNQIAVNLKIYAKKMPLKITTVVGGVSINRQTDEVGRGCDILVATPGRLIDLANRRALTLTATRFLVLDEADQMLDLGFIHDLKRIVKMVPARRQTMLFSATMPKAIAELAGSYLKDPIQVEVSVSGKTADKIDQVVHFVTGKDQKVTMLKDMLRGHPDGRALVFGRTKHGSEKLSKHLEHMGFSVASIHGNKSQGQRDRALKAFRDGDIKILVATDVAARGIDVPGVTHVYNYDLPNVPEAYVHRIGRTARAGREGIAIAFCAPDETKLLSDIERLTGVEIVTGSGTRPDGMRKPDQKGRTQNQRPARADGARKEGGRSDGPRKDGGRNDTRRPQRAKQDQRPAGERSPSERGFSDRPTNPGRRTDLAMPFAEVNAMTEAAAPRRDKPVEGTANRHSPEKRPEARKDNRGPARPQGLGDKPKSQQGQRRPNQNRSGQSRRQG